MCYFLKIKKMYVFLAFLISANLFYVPKMAYALPINWDSTEYKVSVMAAIDVIDVIDTTESLSFEDSTSAPDYTYIDKTLITKNGYKAGIYIESSIDSSSMKVLADSNYSSPSGSSSEGWAEGNFKGTYHAESSLLAFNFFLDDDYLTLGDTTDLKLYSWLKITNVTDNLSLYDRQFSYTDLHPGLINVYTTIGKEIAVDFGIGAYVHASSINNISVAEFAMNYNAGQGGAPQVPEPSSMFLLGSLVTGLFGFAELRRKFSK